MAGVDERTPERREEVGYMALDAMLGRDLGPWTAVGRAVTPHLHELALEVARGSSPTAKERSAIAKRAGDAVQKAALALLGGPTE